MSKTTSAPLLALACCTLLNACASVNTMQTAAVVPEGELRYALSSSAAGGAGDTEASAAPNLEFSLRYGAADNLDLGFKINLLGAQAGVKYQFLASDFDLALGLEAGYQWIRSGINNDPSSHVIHAQIPLLMEYHFNPYVGIAFGPKALGVYVIQSDERKDIWAKSGLYAGFQLGLPLRLTKGLWFMPEINIFTNAFDSDKKYFDKVLWQAAVSIFFGGL